jgi:hypothetical protein
VHRIVFPFIQKCSNPDALVTAQVFVVITSDLSINSTDGSVIMSPRIPYVGILSLQESFGCSAGADYLWSPGYSFAFLNAIQTNGVAGMAIIF